MQGRKGSKKSQYLDGQVTALNSETGNGRLVHPLIPDEVRFHWAPRSGDRDTLEIGDRVNFYAHTKPVQASRGFPNNRMWVAYSVIAKSNPEKIVDAGGGHSYVKHTPQGDSYQRDFSVSPDNELWMGCPEDVEKLGMLLTRWINGVMNSPSNHTKLLAGIDRAGKVLGVRCVYAEVTKILERALASNSVKPEKVTWQVVPIVDPSTGKVDEKYGVLEVSLVKSTGKVVKKVEKPNGGNVVCPKFDSDTCQAIPQKFEAWTIKEFSLRLIM